MVDTSSEINVIKRDLISVPGSVDKGNVIKINGITDDSIYTQGSMAIDLFEKDQDGILGSAFLKEIGGDVMYSQQCIKVMGKEIPFADRKLIHVPARTNAVFKCHVENKEMNEGYLPLLETIPGIYMGNALVKNNESKAYFRVINTTEKDVDIIVPTLELQNFTIEDTDAKAGVKVITAGGNIVKGTKQEPDMTNLDKATRAAQVEPLLRLKHLNDEERRSVIELLKYNADCFHLPGEQLSSTHLLTH